MVFSKKMLHHLVVFVVVFLTLAKIAESKGVLKVRFHDYINPGREDYDGGCCETTALVWKCDECDTYFVICLQKNYRAVATLKNCIKYVQTKVKESDKFYFSTYGTRFGSKGETNPLVYNFDNTWQGQFSIYMTVYDDDSGHILGIGSKRDKVDVVLEGFRFLVAGPDSSHPRRYSKSMVGHRTAASPTVTAVELTLYCSPDYYNAYCTTYCKPQNSDATGHYTCEDYTGEKKCRIGWQGKDCKKPICETGCKNGGCSKPGECICAANWKGTRCDQCIATAGCLNGVCRKGGDCICLQDWSGNLCDKDLNSCRSSPCQNGARCENNGTKYLCHCVPGYKGTHCENEIDLCSSSPCMNNATCVNFRTDFQCQCRPGFKGQKCEQNIDECKLMNYCANNATCVDGINNYTCDCLPGFSGRYCEHDVDECLSNPCRNGICKDSVNNYTCSCMKGFRGRHCDENINDCDPNPCRNKGNCTDDIDDFICSCVQGWIGKKCSSNFDECAGNPCRNNGTCNDGNNDYNCTCPSGFKGKDCQININDCQPQPCQNSGLCTDAVNSYSCQCKPGFSGPTCAENIDECKVKPCLHGGQCTDCINQYQCECALGYAGHDCETNIDDCASNPCLNNATCIDGIANFSCNCSLGYEGYHCDKRINHCKNVTCQYGGQCVNELGRYRCDCRRGFNGTHCENTPCVWRPCEHNGTCELKENSILGFKCNCFVIGGHGNSYEGDLCEKDIDNCDPNNHDFSEGIGVTEDGLCGTHGHCVDYVGRYECNCSEGWRGLMCHININECNRYPCRNNGECRERVNEPGYHCICPTGYNGTNCETMINLCDQNPCCEGAICSHGLNSFTCNCSNGLKGPSCCSNSTWCSPDLFNVSTCNNHGNCTSLENKFDCSCQDGYTGSRCETDINECKSRPCINGNCVNLLGTYECFCDEDMTGKNCEQRINDCEGVVCQNNGTCVDATLNYTCKCNGYRGRHCEIDINECEEENDCSPSHGVCKNTNGSYYCECRLGYHNPPECTTTIDHCLTSPCEHGTCHNYYSFVPTALVTNYSCSCYPGWDGRHCDKQITCGCENGHCARVNGEKVCECGSDYEGSKCSEPISAKETKNKKRDGSNRTLTIGMPFVAFFVILVAFVVILLVIRRRRLSRNQDGGTVKFTNTIDESLDAPPEPLMFVNPVFLSDKGRREQQILDNHGANMEGKTTEDSC